MVEEVEVTWQIILVMMLLGLVVGGYSFWVIYTKKINLTNALYYNHKKGIDMLCSSPYVSPMVRMCVRIAFALYSIVSLCYTYTFGSKMCGYYTVWNYSFLTYYWVVSGYWAYRYAEDSKDDNKKDKEIGKKASKKKDSNIVDLISASASSKKDVEATIDSMSWTTKVFRLSIWFFGWHQMCCTPLVATVVWGLLFPPSKEKNTFFGWDSINMHILNVPMIYLDFVIGNQPYEFHFLAFVLVIALCYALWSWCVKAIWGFWPYVFLDTTNERDSVMYFLISVLHVVYWIVVFGFFKLRQYVRTHTTAIKKMYRRLTARVNKIIVVLTNYKKKKSHSAD